MNIDGTFTKPKKGTVLLDKKPIATVSAAPNENVIFLGPFGPQASMFWNLPPESYMVYVHATETGRDAHRKRIAAGDYLFFKMGGGLFDETGGPIHEIWRRTPKDIIAIARVAAGEQGDWRGVIYVDMMTVREPWRRAGVNTLLMKTLQRRFPGRRLAFSQPTHEGSDFIRAAHERGMDIELPTTLKKKVKLKIEGPMSDLGIVLRTPQLHLERIERDAREGNCDWARFQLEVMRQKATNDPDYAALLPQAETVASSCASSALHGTERVNETFQNRVEERMPMASVHCEGGWKKCKEAIAAPTLSATQFPAKYAEHKSPTLVTRSIDGQDITPQNLGAPSKKCMRSGDKTKALRKAHVELVMLPADVASTIGTKAGPHVRMCHKVGQDGALIPVNTPEESLEVATSFRKCQTRETAQKCARKKSQVIG